MLIKDSEEKMIRNLSKESKKKLKGNITFLVHLFNKYLLYIFTILCSLKSTNVSERGHLSKVLKMNGGLSKLKEKRWHGEYFAKGITCATAQMKKGVLKHCR